MHRYVDNSTGGCTRLQIKQRDTKRDSNTHTQREREREREKERKREKEREIERERERRQFRPGPTQHVHLRVCLSQQNCYKLPISTRTQILN